MQFRIVRDAQKIMSTIAHQSPPDAHTVELYVRVVEVTFASFVFRHTWYQEVADVTLHQYYPTFVDSLRTVQETLRGIMAFVNGNHTTLSK